MRLDLVAVFPRRTAGGAESHTLGQFVVLDVNAVRALFETLVELDNQTHPIQPVLGHHLEFFGRHAISHLFTLAIVIAQRTRHEKARIP